MMRSRAWVVVAAVVVAGGVLVPADLAAAVTGAFAATCVTTGGPSGPVTSHPTITYSVDAPDSVGTGATFTVPITVGYAVSSTANAGGAIFAVTGATPAQPEIDAPSGAAQISGALSLTASATPGVVATITLRQFGAFAQVGPTVVAQSCTPDRPLVLARVGVGVPLVSIGDAAIVEGSTGTRGLQLAVTLSRPAATVVTVPFTVEDGSATAGSDYVAQSGTVSLRAGLVSGIATVRVRGDATVEPKENFRVRLHDPVGAVIGRAVGTGRIIDDDPEPGLRLSIGDASAVEGNRGARSTRFAVSLSAPAAHDIWFHYSTVDGTAVATGDYRAQDSDCFIPAGHSSITVPVPILPDGTPEPATSFVVKLTGPPANRTGATIGRAKGVGSIIDDD